MNYLLANPSAGNGFDRAFWRRQLRAAGVEVRNWPDRDTQQPQLGADDRLLVAGGDGTMNAQVNRCVTSGCVLGVLPSGTGNDFANGLGIPVDLEQACRTLADGRVGDTVRPVAAGAACAGDTEPRGTCNTPRSHAGGAVTPFAAHHRRWRDDRPHAGAVRRRARGTAGIGAATPGYVQCTNRCRNRRRMRLHDSAAR